MNKQELLRLMRLLSSLESLMLARRERDLPDYLHDELSEMVSVLEREILK